MYDEAVPALRRLLGALSGSLDKAQAHCAQSGTDPAALLNHRLAPDMWSLTQQVQAATDNARRCMYRLTGTEPVAMDDLEADFDALRRRIADTLAVIEATPRDAIEAGRERLIKLPVGDHVLDMTGPDYLRHFLLPNFYFHCTAAYAIMRAKGVPLSKYDFIGRF